MITNTDIQSRFGIVQWFAQGDRELVLKTAARLGDLGVRNLRTGISWCEYESPGGEEWYDWMTETLSSAGLSLLVMLCYTPPSISETGDCRGAPRNLDDFALFAGRIASRYREKIREFQIWNEPNNDHYWDQKGDPSFGTFAPMAEKAARAVRERGARAVLGGVISGNGWAPRGKGWQPDATFMNAMRVEGVLETVDAIAFHSFPGMWVSGDPERPDHPEWSWGEPLALWNSWKAKAEPYSILGGGLPVIVSETGFSTYDWETKSPGRYDEQSEWLKRAAESGMRIYWYSLFDLPPGRASIGGENGTDPRNPHFGLLRNDGTPKPAYEILKKLLR